MHIHLARWIVTPGRPPLEDGGVVTFGGKIVAVDRAATLRSHYHGKVTDHGDAIICPPLVNAHCHLELSPLDYKLKPARPGPGSFSSWVNQLIALRETISHDQWENAIEDAVFQLVDNGVAVLGDVGNAQHVPAFIKKIGSLWPFLGIFFQEIIAPSENRPLQLDNNLDNNDNDTPCERLSAESAPAFIRALSPHAAYTVAPSALKALSNWNLRRGLPLAIHLAESPDEMEFFKKGEGPLCGLMKERGHWPPDWDIPLMSPVKYLDHLGCLHEKTLCIHCVQVDTEDMALIASRKASVCLCPRSNYFIGVGIAPAAEMHRAGINLALGTDSLASNRRLSIFSEMAELARNAPELPPEAIFTAATLGGARALGLDRETGRIEPGRTALFLIVQGKCESESEVMEFLVNQAESEAVNTTLTEG